MTLWRVKQRKVDSPKPEANRFLVGQSHCAAKERSQHHRLQEGVLFIEQIGAALGNPALLFALSKMSRYVTFCGPSARFLFGLAPLAQPDA